MGFIRKRDTPLEVIDIPDLQRRGFVKKGEEIRKEGLPVINKEGLLDFTKIEPSSEVSVPTSGLNGSIDNSASNPFGMLESFSQMAATNTSTFPEQPGAGGVDTPPSLSNAQNSEDKYVHGLKLKIEDLEFKLEQLLEKFEQIDSRLREFERNSR